MIQLTKTSNLSKLSSHFIANPLTLVKLDMSSCHTSGYTLPPVAWAISAAASWPAFSFRTARINRAGLRSAKWCAADLPIPLAFVSYRSQLMQPERKDDDDIPVGSCHNDCPSFESTLRKGQRFLLEDDIFGDRVGCERHPGWESGDKPKRGL